MGHLESGPYPLASLEISSLSCVSFSSLFFNALGNKGQLSWFCRQSEIAPPSSPHTLLIHSLASIQIVKHSSIY